MDLTALSSILLTVFGTLLTGLAGFALKKLTNWLDSKISDKNALKIVTNIITLVETSVKEIYQTYVASLKDKNMFDPAAQKEALANCLAKVKSQLLPEATDYIASTYGDVDVYLTSLIESTIYTLKLTAKTAK